MLINSIFSVFLIHIFLWNIPSSPLYPHPLVSFILENCLELEMNKSYFTPNQALGVFSESLYSHVKESGTCG